MSGSPHKAISIAAALAAFALSGCGVYAHNVRATTPTRDFANLTCAELAAEKARIEAGYAKFNGTTRYGARATLGVLNADAYEVNDQIRVDDCKIGDVRTLVYSGKNGRRVEYHGGSQVN